MPKLLKCLIASGLIAAVGVPASALACTRILSNANGQSSVTARTMDLDRPDHAQMAVFPRGMTRTSDTGEGPPLQWTSRCGSVAVTARGVLTSDGMNEEGLVANILYLGDTQYEPRNEQPGLSNLLWGQYVLDNFSSVEEALEGLQEVLVVPVSLNGTQWPLHLAISDAEGDSAVIEFVDGKMVVHHGKEYTVMTNEPPLDVQLENIKKYKLFGGTLALPGDIDPESRFVRAATYLKTLPRADSVEAAIADIQGIARNVAVPRAAVDTSGSEAVDAWPTLWFTLADTKNRTYIFHSAAAPNVYWVELSELDFEPGSGQRTVDAYDTSLAGDITQRLD